MKRVEVTRWWMMRLRWLSMVAVVVLAFGPVAGAQILLEERVERAVEDLLSVGKGVDTDAAFRRIEGRPGGKLGAVYRLIDVAGSADAARSARAKWAIWCLAGPDGYHVLFDRLERWERMNAMGRWAGLGFPFDDHADVRLQVQQALALAAVGRGGYELPLARTPRGPLALALAVECAMRDAVWQAAAVRMARESGPGDALFLPELLKGLESRDVGQRVRAQELADVLINWRYPTVVEGLAVCAARDDSRLAVDLLSSFPESARWIAVQRLVRMRATRPREATAALARLGVLDVDVARLAVEVAERDPAAARELLEEARRVGAPVESEDVRKALTLLLELDDAELRVAAARLLGRDDVLVRERVPELLRGLRSDDPEARCRAANGIHLSGVFDARVTSALVRATERRDLAAREGLTLALERGQQEKREPIEVLRQLAAREDAARDVVYARAALRGIGER